MSDERRRENPWTRLVAGLSIFAAGVIFWLDRIDRLDAREWIRWWPLALIALGLAHLPQRRFVAGGLWILAGSIFMLRIFGYDLNVWNVIGLWPLLISAAGLTIIGNALRPRPAGTRFQATAVMAGNTRTVGSQNFAHGEAVAVMGACEIDFAAARLEPDAAIDVLAFWGGIEIRVPRGWRVIGRVAPILGGYEDKTAPAADGAPTLTVRGTAIMGGVEVLNS